MRHFLDVVPIKKGETLQDVIRHSNAHVSPHDLERYVFDGTKAANRHIDNVELQQLTAELGVTEVGINAPWRCGPLERLPRAPPCQMSSDQHR